MNFKIKEIKNICNGELYCGDSEAEVSSFSIDTRTISKGDVYIGIKGQNFDGNLFYEEAFDKGASAVILDKESFKNSIKISKSIILVKDTKLAMAKLASYLLESKNIPVIAITGSVGKTSTRDMIHAVLAKKYNAFKTLKNYNNDIGMPLSILNIKNHNAAVLEMGMNNLGEIAYLSKIAKPNIVIITSIAPVHIENLGTMENILKAKLEILEGLRDDGIFIFNNDNEYLRNADIKNRNILTCGIDNPSDLQVTGIDENTFQVLYKNEKMEFNHHNLTKPFIQNMLIAIACGILLDIPLEDIKEALENFNLTEGRLEHIELNNNILLINDAYNASSESMKNAIDYLIKQRGKRKILILGNMRELGDYSEALHSEVGKYIDVNKIDYLLTVGSDAKFIYGNANIINKKHFQTKEEIYPFLDNFFQSEDTIIVKASNGEKFIEIINFIKKKYCD